VSNVSSAACHRVVPEEREVTDMVPVIEYVDTPRIERVPRVIVEGIEERSLSLAWWRCPLESKLKNSLKRRPSCL
jgi:hypothetical protein